MCVCFLWYHIDIICSASAEPDDEVMEVAPTRTSNRGRRKRKSKENDDKADVEEATSSSKSTDIKKRKLVQCCYPLATCMYNALYSVYRTESDAQPEEASLFASHDVLELSQRHW